MLFVNVYNMLRTLRYTDPPRDLISASDLIDRCFATTMRAIRAASSGALNGFSPGALVFSRDMFLDVPLIADIMAIAKERKVRVNESLRKANAKRLSYDYKVGEQVLVKLMDMSPRSKMLDKWEGPYSILTVHCNGTITIQLRQNVEERLNIRRVKPYRSMDKS